MKVKKLTHISKMKLPKYLAIIPVAEELVTYIPSFSFSFYWTNRHHEIVHAYDDSDIWPDVAPEYYSDFCNTNCDDAHPSLAKWHKNCSGTVSSLDYNHNGYYNSHSYRRIWNRLGYYHSLMASIKNEGSPVGILKLHRRISEAPYSYNDCKKLNDVLPLITERLNSENAEINISLMGSDTFGVIIIDHNGEVQFVSPSAKKLLYLCADAEVSLQKRHIQPNDIDIIYVQMVSLCDSLRDKGNAQHSSAVEKKYIQNRWGGFSFIASWLQAPTDTSPGKFCINIQYYEPSCVKMLRNCESYSLTFRQIQICILLSEKMTFDEIANELHLSPHTVIDHMKKVYCKLGVVSRNEVVQQLMSA